MEVKWLDILHDCDDNLYPFVPAFLEHLNDKHWTSYRPEEITDYQFSVTKMDRDEIGAEVFRFYQSQKARQLKPYEGAVEQIVRLHELGYRQGILSGRSSKLFGYTIDSIRRDFPSGIFDEESIYLTNQFSSRGSKTTKANVMTAARAKVLTEDCLETALNVAEAGYHVIMPNTYWNQNGTHDMNRIIRIGEGKNLALPGAWPKMADAVIKILSESLPEN